MCYSFNSANRNLPNSSCHFWMHKSVFLQILHQSSEQSKITPLYFFYIAQTLFTLVRGAN